MIVPALLGLLLMQAPVGALERFFVGRTEGTGTVHVMLSGRHGVRDHSRGGMDRSGALIIDQIVEEEGKPARRRTWRLARSGPNGIVGTISDARGPVTGAMSGNVLTLRYRLAEGPSVEQRIVLQPGGRTALNHMTFRRFGFNVATVEEILRRAD